PHGLHRAGDLQLQRAGPAGCGDPDGQPRPDHPGALPACRLDPGANGQPRPLRPLRPGAADPRPGRRLPGRHPGRARAARPHRPRSQPAGAAADGGNAGTGAAVAVMLAATTVNYGWSQALSDMAQISPVLVVSVALLVAMLLDLVLPGRVRGATAAGVSLAGLIGAIVAALLLYQSRGHGAYSNFATGDDFAVYFHVFFAVLGILTILVTHPYLARRN